MRDCTGAEPHDPRPEKKSSRMILKRHGKEETEEEGDRSGVVGVKENTGRPALKNRTVI